jgi:hypothetical protein
MPLAIFLRSEITIVSQSSTVSGLAAQRAYDGNTNGISHQGSVTATAREAQPWWEADLGEMTWIRSVEVYGRTDCCTDRLTNFNVSVSSNKGDWKTVNVPGPAANPTVVNFTGLNRYVRIQLVGTNQLELAEVHIKTL